MKFCSIPDCDNPVEGRTEMCASHNYEQRKSEKQSKKVTIVRPANKVSPKRAKELQEYNKLQKEQLKEHPECQIKILGVCIGKATTNHHSAKRGKNYLNKETFLSACLPCHEFLETKLSAAERRDLGLLKTV